MNAEQIKRFTQKLRNKRLEKQIAYEQDRIDCRNTAIACINTNRNYIGFELDKGYFDIANERIEKHKTEDII